MAAYWWRKSAEQGNAGAQYNLGQSYEKGRGVPQDDAVAYALADLAAAGGESANFRDRLIRKLTPLRIAMGQALAQELARPGNFATALDAWLASDHQ